MAKKLSEIYAPKPQGEKDFVAKHPVKKNAVHQNKQPEQFTAGKVKTFDRSAKRMGYDADDDEKAYGVGEKPPSPNNQRSSPDNGSTLYPTGKFAEEEEMDEASFVNKQKKKEYEEKKGRDQGAKNTTAAKRLARKEKPNHVSEEDEIVLTDDDIDDLLDILDAVLKEDMYESDVYRGDKSGARNSPLVSNAAAKRQSSTGYNKDSVDSAIKNNRTGKIGNKEAKMIHGLLKGWRGK